jgi:hypothetical protein
MTLRPLVLALPLLACFAAPAAHADADPASLYDLKWEAPSKLAKGAGGTLVVKIAPHKEAHVSKEAPTGLKLSAPEGLSLSKTSAKNPDVKWAGEVASFEVPFTAVQPGAHKIDASVNFVVCVEQACHMQKRTASLPVAVQ